MSAKSQVAIVFVILFFGYLVAQLVALGLMAWVFGDIEATKEILSNGTNNPSHFKSLIWINFVVQGVWALITYFGIKTFLSKIPIPSWTNLQLLPTSQGLIWILVSIPAVYGVAFWTEPLLPESWLQTDLETSSNAFYENLISSTSGAFLPVFLSTVIGAPIFEEFIFRGSVFPAIKVWTNSNHIAIWTTAILFSAIHLQLSGFLPRMLLGALLGYLTLWSNSLIPAIFAHGAFNAFSLFMSMTKEYEERFNSYVEQHWVPIISLWLAIAAYFYLKSKNTSKERHNQLDLLQ
jgi:membrane protease YdiL (CAAX protease family)